MKLFIQTELLNKLIFYLINLYTSYGSRFKLLDKIFIEVSNQLTFMISQINP